MRRRRLLQIVAWSGIALASLALVLSTSLIGLAAMEQRDTFCVACHLHGQKFERFVSAPPTDLAGPHHAKDVRCIDCHGGADLGMRLRVWNQAALDTARFIVGDYREPQHMRIRLRPKDCARCHTPIVRSAAALTVEQEEEQEGQGGNAYHAIRPHDAVRINCIECHAVHATDAGPGTQFIARARVQPICRRCHATLGE